MKLDSYLQAHIKDMLHIVDQFIGKVNCAKHTSIFIETLPWGAHLSYHLNPITVHKKDIGKGVFSTPGRILCWHVLKVGPKGQCLSLFWCSTVWCKTWASLTICKMIEEYEVVSQRGNKSWIYNENVIWRPQEIDFSFERTQ